jgi:competence protein ComEC
MARLGLPSATAGMMAGILAQDVGWLPGSGSALLVVVACGGLLASAAAATRRPRGAAIGIVVLAAAVGAWRGTSSALPTGPGSVAALVDTGSLLIHGEVVDDPRPRGERQQVVLDRVSVATQEFGTQRVAVAGRVLVWLPRAAVVTGGDIVAFESALEAPRDFDGFAYRAYLARQGIAAVASTRRPPDVVDHDLGSLESALAGLRRWLLSGLNAVVPEPEAALADGILLGVRSGISPEVSDAFSTAGLTHVVAISGWNIAIVAALAAAATRPLRRFPAGGLLAVGLAAGSVGAYVVITGASPSVVRAALMAGTIVLARGGGSRAHAASALMLAALLMLAIAPPLLWDVGFQLSALATGGLILFGAGIEARLRRWPGMLREPVALTLAAQLTTMPVILLNFERLSLVAPLANVVVVPLVPIVMLCSALAAVAGAVGMSTHLPPATDLLAWACGGAAWLYLRAMILAGSVAAAVPLASLDLSAPPWLALAWYPALIPLRRRIAGRSANPDRQAAGSAPPPSAEGQRIVDRLLRPRVLVVITILLLALLTACTQPDGRLHLVALDVGQGDAILVRAPSGATALIDGGPDPDLTVRRLGEELPFWQRDIDLVVLTHPHEDHVAGLIPALERYRVAAVVEPGRAYDNPTYPRFTALAAEEPGATYRLARAGEIVQLDPSTQLRILFPSGTDADAPLPEGDINNASVVALLTHGDFRALLTGDAEAPVEALLLERGLLVPVDVLKVGHHGSDSSSTPAFLAALRPRIALISAGVENQYGHPHASTLQHLSAVPGLQVLRTDLQGTVEVVADGTDMAAGGQRPTDPSSIGPWPSRLAMRQSASWRRSRCRRASSPTWRAWRGWRRRRRGWWRPPGSRSMPGWSRAPPCCTTSTSWKRAAS